MTNLEGLSQKIAKMLLDIQSEKDKSIQQDKFKHLISFMNTKQMKEIYKVYLELGNLSKEEIELLRLILECCNTIYNYSGEETGLSDSEYDSLVEYYRSLTDSDGIITEPLIAEGDVAYHKYKTLRGTLDKIYKLTDEDVLKNQSQKSLDDWIKQMERRYLENTGETIDLRECDVLVMPKYDGVSCVFENDKNGNMIRALTRGDTTRNEAQDITHIFKGIYKGPFSDAPSEYGEKTEIMMLNDDLDTYNELYHKDYKNTRSIVSSILNSDEADERVKYLKIIPLRYSFYEDGKESQQYVSPGIYNYPYLNCKLKDVDLIHDFAIHHKYVEPGLRCDGAVIYIKDEKVQKALGRENEKQKFEVAFKFTEETAYTEIKDVIFTTGLFGRLNPVAVFKTVKMKGNDVSQASLGSLKRFQKLQLAKGDRVKVLYDIIPYVQFDEKDDECKRSSHDPIKAPEVCPDCGEPVEVNESGNILYCKNPKCPCRIKGRILNYLRKMNIGEISYETVNDFYNLGYLKSIEDLYHLKEFKNELTQIPGYGASSISKILKEIDSVKDVTPSLLLGSLGIESLSTKRFKSILEYLSFSELIEYAMDNQAAIFTVIPGIKEKTAIKLIDGIHENIDLIMFLMEVLNVLDEPTEVHGDFKVCFTKVRDSEKEAFIKEHGGEVVDDVTKETSFVVVPSLAVESSKTKKATKYGLPLVLIDDLENYINLNYS